MANGDTSRFEALLSQLHEEHHNEINLLRDEVKKLQESQDLLVGRDCENSVSDEAVSESALGLLALEDEVPWERTELDGWEKQESTAHDQSAVQAFELRAVWVQKPASLRQGHDLDQRGVSFHLLNMSKTSMSLEDVPKRNHQSTSSADTVRTITTMCFLVSPAHPSRISWDLTGMLLISFDMIAIPIHVSFEPDDNWFTDGMGWLCLIFWTFDMFTSLFTGYYSEGKLIMDHQRIIRNYFQGWFWVDVIIVVPDWVMKLMGSMINVAGLGRVLRALRVMRILRLLRIMKLKKIFNLVYNLIDSEYMFIVFNLIRLLAMILVLNHMVACAWYSVGRLTQASGFERNWLQNVGITKVWETTLAWKYFTSLHWSITQFTPASMDIYATNVPERIFSIAILFWALVALSSIIGSVSASMTALRNMSSDEMKQFWLLRRYLKQKGITRALSDRIEKFLEFQCMHANNLVDPTKVTLLPKISPQLQLELAGEMEAPLLQQHPFFDRLPTEVATVMFRICHLAVKGLSFAVNDIVFQSLEEAYYMYFVKDGTFQYKIDGHVFECPLGPRAWASEAVLWTAWTHRGLLKAVKPSNLLTLSPNKFSEVLSAYGKTWSFARRYGLQFIAFMNEINNTQLSDVVFQFEMDGWSWVAGDKMEYEIDEKVVQTSDHEEDSENY